VARLTSSGAVVAREVGWGSHVAVKWSAAHRTDGILGALVDSGGRKCRAGTCEMYRRDGHCMDMNGVVDTQ